MGKIKRGILGGFSGKVANVIGTSWKGIAVMKSMPLSVANPRTTAQVKNRERNTGVLHIAQNVGVLAIRSLWNRWASGMSGFNHFMQVNRNCWSVLGIFQEASFSLSKGVYPQLKTDGVVASISAAGQNLLLNITPSANYADYAADDKVYVCVINSSGKVLNVVSDFELVGDSPYSIALEGVTALNMYSVFISILKADGTQVSDSALLHVLSEA